MFYNTFDNVAAVAYTGLQRYRDALEKAGAAEIHLAGSGPLLFSMFSSRQAALAAQAKLSQINVDSIVAPGVARDEAGY